MDERRRADDSKIDVLEERVKNWMAETTEYRRSLYAKLDIISEKLNVLPCGERKSWYNSVNRQILFIWTVLTGLVIGLFKEMFFRQ